MPSAVDVRVAVGDQLANHRLNRRDVLRRVRLVVVLEHAELAHRRFELGVVALDDGVVVLAGFPRRVDAAIVDVGDVLHVRDAVAAVREIPPQDVEKKKRARVPEMRLRRRRQAADVDPHVAVAQRRELLDAARPRVVESQSSDHPAPGFFFGRFALLELGQSLFESRRAAAAAARSRRPSDRASRLAAARQRRAPVCRPARRRAPGRRRRWRSPARL